MGNSSVWEIAADEENIINQKIIWYYNPAFFSDVVSQKLHELHKVMTILLYDTLVKHDGSIQDVIQIVQITTMPYKNSCIRLASHMHTPSK
jgi:hypothetical protein